MDTPHSAKATRGEEEPLAYIIGDQPFLGLTIYLDSRPLIPRPETEWWTEQLLNEIDKKGELVESKMGVRLGRAARSAPIFGSNSEPKLKFLDLCSGSGAIGCAALAHFPSAQVYFGEIDSAHEATILKNIRENNLDESRAHIYIGDLFAPFPTDLAFDVIAVNPPYIPSGRILPESVANYEPALALRAGTDGLDVIRRIATSVRCHLAEQGVLWCECDSAHADAACALFKAQGFSADIRLDQYGVPRIIVCRHTSARSAQ